jgi:hypothetical protein
MYNVSMVVGNGESRSSIEIDKFKDDYMLIGCNALHRDTRVEHLVCCDRRMVEEAVESENTTRSKIYVRPDWYKYFRKIQKDKRIHQVPDIPYKGNKKQDNPIHWGSGTYAVLLAAELSNTVLLVGFDLYPNNDKVNNIYKGTNNYSKKDSKPVDPSFWIYQIGKVFQHYKDTDFIIWNKADWVMPKEWQYPNVSFEEIS